MSREREDGKAGRGRRRALAKFAAVLGVIAFLAQGQATHAATITVNTTADELNSNGNCSLREAIHAANTDAAVDACSAGSGADTIVLPAGIYTLSIAGADEDANASGDLDITSDLTIIGAGAATTNIDGAALDRVFHIQGGTVEISAMTIQNGFSDVCGGIYNNATLTLTNSTVSGNFATYHGGICNIDTLTLTNSTVSGNSATYHAGGILIVSGGTATITSSTISGNTTTGGGGILILSGGTATITSSTVSGNTANAGGGILNDGVLIINNSTVSGNTDSSGQGGGIWQAFAGGTLQIQSSTVNGNTGHGIGLSTGTFTLKNTILANNTGNDCTPVLGYDSVTSLGYNLIENNACSIGGNTTGNITGSDPLLGPLANNGGPTQTHALLVGSPAIDAGSPDCPPPATDQRGFARPVDGDGDGTATCDIGAYEFGSTGPSVRYAFVGFHQPVDNLPAINAARAGRTIPVKWSLQDAQGNFISSLGSFVSLLAGPIPCDAAPSAEVEEQLTSPGSTTLRYDATTNQFIFNWQSSSGWRGCRLLQLTLADGSRHYAKFNFR
ncbi:MAG: PxKF domain-containing protein [Acidobacteria bacterium]|nr:PxKF domain-containing protein [Acidobacteriota bacterium]